jgi:predicted dehydrogenase
MMSVRTPVGIGLIGAGRHGIRYARHIVQDLAGAALVAVCRRHPEEPLDLTGAENVRMYGDPRAMIADPSVAVVVVVTPPIYTREISLEAIRAHKPLLIEKPLAAFYADARAIVEASATASVPLMTAQTLRFDPVVQALKDKRRLVGRVQELLLISNIDTKGRGVDYADGYGKRGALLEFGVHVLDLVRFVTGEEIREVRCTMDRVPPAAPDSSAFVQLTTSGGSAGRMEVRRVPAGRIGLAEVIGSEGRLSADWVRRCLRFQPGTGSGQEWNLPPAPTVLATLTAFLEALADGRSMPVTGEDGCRAVELAEACYRSAEAGGRPVTLPLPA